MLPQPSPNTLYDMLQQDSLVVAPQLLGCTLISTAGGSKTGGVIVEAEAYHGPQDPASHAYRGLTLRTAPMFEAGGTIYVYLSYGIHTCVNITTGRKGEGQAVLIRALEPTIGLTEMIPRRKLPSGQSSDPRLLTVGPGRLTQALGITLGLSGTRLGETLTLLMPARPPAPANIAAGPRVGITKAADNPWRFYLKDNPFVSRR